MMFSKCRGVTMAEGLVAEGTMAFLIAGLLSLPWVPICITTCLCREDMGSIASWAAESGYEKSPA